MRRRRAAKGTILIWVLLLVGAIMAAMLAAHDVLLLHGRSVRRTVERIERFHQADTVLSLCTHRLLSQRAVEMRAKAGLSSQTRSARTITTTALDRLKARMATVSEPRRWREAPLWLAFHGLPLDGDASATFERIAFSRNGVSLVCLQERWIDHPQWGDVHLLTVRAPLPHAPDVTSEDHGPVWLQAIVVRTPDTWERQWRTVAEPP